MPKGYIIGHVTVTNPEAYKAYAQRNDEIFPRYGGRFLVRGGAARVLEGDLFERHVVIEFPDYASAQAAYHSAEYQENMKIRLANATGAVVVAEGYDP